MLRWCGCLYFASVIAAISTLSKYDLVAATLLTLLVVGAVAIAVMYVIKRSGNRSSNIFFALLLLAFSATITALIFEHVGLSVRYPRLAYAPIWLTWTIGPAWFYYVKFSLFPAYRFRWTDMKHFAFPIFQVLGYSIVFFSGELSLAPDAIFGIPATTIDESIFLLSVGGYLFASYRYLRYRAREIGNKPLRWDFWKVKLLRRSQRVIFVLLTFNFAFVAFNFLSEQTLGQSLQHMRSFYASSSLSFGLILLYLLRGVAYRQHFYPQVPPEELAGVSVDTAVRLQTLIEAQGGFRDPDLHEVRVARAVGLSPKQLQQLSLKQAGKPWRDYVRGLRIAEVRKLRRASFTLRRAALEAGFASRRAALGAFGRRG